MNPQNTLQALLQLAAPSLPLAPQTRPLISDGIENTQVGGEAQSWVCVRSTGQGCWFD